MSSKISYNIKTILNELPEHVRLVVVTKMQPYEIVMEAYGSGYRHFGENRVQELLKKREQLPEDIEWHLIGHLQSNKVKYVVPFVSFIESVDSYKLLKTINREASKYKRRVRVLLQIHIAQEENKFGFDMGEIKEMLADNSFMTLNNIEVAGVMGMATFTDDPVVIRKEFRYLSDCFNEMKQEFFSANDCFREISMGMSGDYKIAIEEGSTNVRIGTLIFGERKAK